MYYFQCNKLRDGEKYQFLRDAFRTYDSSTLVGLARLPAKFIVTTNYDRALFDAIAKAQATSPLDYVYGDPDFPGVIFEEQFHVARLHGCAERPRTIQLTSAHYEAIRNDNSYIDVLTHLFSRTNLLFLGFSFLDPAIQLVLETVNKRLGPRTDGRHVALLPSNASGDFLARLERLNVAKVFYESTPDHAALWAAINSFSAATQAAAKPKGSPAPLGQARRYLAACYARVQMKHSLRPLAKTVVEGIVSQLLQNAQEGMTKDVLAQLVRGILRLDNSSASDLCDSALDALQADNLCTVTQKPSKTWTWTGPRSADQAIDSSIAKVAMAVCNRYVVHEGGQATSDVRKCVDEVVWHLVLKRGWDLGAAYASGRPPEDIDVEAVVARAGPFLSWKVIEALARTFTNLFRQPTAEEERELTALGRVSFALELILNTPRDALFHKEALPERIYLDANVLMPALTLGHPFHDIYRSVIQRLMDAAAEAKSTVEIVATSGILNEVISHRTLAEAEVKSYGQDALRSIATEIGLFGSHNVNVFVGAYSALLRRDPSLKFGDFLAKHAPYTTETELASWLKQKRIAIVEDAKADQALRAKISYELQKAFADELERGKRNLLLIDHDAAQLALLERDKQEGRRSLLVSADKRLRFAIGASQYPALAETVVSHIGLTQMVDLLVGLPEDQHDLGRLIWSSKVSTDTQQLHLYLLNRASAEYDEAILMNMGDVVEQIAAEAAESARHKNISFDFHDFKGREALLQFMQGYEDQFFAALREKIEKRLGEAS
ncbi:hypothetical protein DSM104443_00605 [Usitatibacter rugosus]|uniref:Uncharacterized protein n=2 Tax=Usitatibacter rugosus TaxID=2732067 RepID=A0A6M4GR52_9PROT|nr:hypothetical protein DSM104443_00605 [Usitatibacter rugosus]